VHNTLWALEVLAEAGFRYDSSIFPVRRPRYGIPEWPIAPVQVRLPGRKYITEFPVATFRCLGKNWPVGGGGYHRVLPGFMSRHFAKKIMASDPFIFYCHPYEFDYREFKEIPIKIPLHVRLHQGVGRRWFKQRFMTFLDRFGGQPIEDFLSSKLWPEFVLEFFPSHTG